MNTLHQTITNSALDGHYEESAHLTAEYLSAEEVQVERAEKADQVIWYVAGLVNSLLALRIVFFLLAARAVGFAQFMYSLTDPLVAPFRGTFPIPAMGSNVFDTGALVAIIVYTMVAWAVSSLVALSMRPAPLEA